MGHKKKTNQTEGKAFEKIFETLAKYSGMLPIRNHQACRVWKGGFALIKSNLDYTLHNIEGQTAYLDCKSFAGESFEFSDIDGDQLSKAILYEHWKIPSGFLVFFRKTREVSFFPASYLMAKGSGNSFQPAEAVYLGKLEDMNLKRIFEGRPKVGL